MKSFNFYAKACGASVGPGPCPGRRRRRNRRLLRKVAVLDEALAKWAEAYGDQTERDHARLVKAIKSGKVKAILEV